jgi:hypothetical protein
MRLDAFLRVEISFNDGLRGEVVLGCGSGRKEVFGARLWSQGRVGWQQVEKLCWTSYPSLLLYPLVPGLLVSKLKH